MADRMILDANPEKQLRPVTSANPKGGVHDGFKGIQIPSKPILQDIGRDWISRVGYKKQGEDHFTRWERTKKMIRILWPTIRPREAMDRANEWREKATRHNARDHFRIQFGINDEAHRKAFEDAGEDYMWFDVRPGVCATATKMSRAVAEMCCDTDIIVLASDDYSAPIGWDYHLAAQYAGAFRRQVHR